MIMFHPLGEDSTPGKHGETTVFCAFCAFLRQSNCSFSVSNLPQATRRIGDRRSGSGKASTSKNGCAWGHEPEGASLKIDNRC
jgi:hypothetical protein